jgi:hypothetical protein
MMKVVIYGIYSAIKEKNTSKRMRQHLHSFNKRKDLAFYFISTRIMLYDLRTQII